MNIKNKGNQYQRKYPAFDKTPKEIVAAIAFSLAMRASEDDEVIARQMLVEEWDILHMNGIVMKGREG